MKHSGSWPACGGCSGNESRPGNTEHLTSQLARSKIVCVVVLRMGKRQCIAVCYCPGSVLKIGALHRAPYIVTFRYFIDAERGANHA
jgi:hypothetical protein